MSNVNLEINYMHRPVANLAALKAIDTTLILDSAIISVNGYGIGHFVKLSTATPDDILIVQPTTGGGRWFFYNESTPVLLSKSGAILSPRTVGDSLNIVTGCVGNTSAVSGYASRFQSYINSILSISNENYDYTITSGGDSYQSFTAVNNDYFSSMIFFYASSPGAQTISFYNGEGTGGTLISTWSQNLNSGTISPVIPIKLTSGNKYTIRFQGAAFTLQTDGGGWYAGGSLNGSGQSMGFDIYTKTQVESFTINKTTGAVLARLNAVPNLALANGIMQIDGSGNLSASTSLPSVTNTPTQAYGVSDSTLANTNFVQLALAGLPAQLWQAVAGVLRPNDNYSINIGSCGLGNIDSLSGYNFKYLSSAQALSVSVLDGVASEFGGAGDIWFSFTALDSKFLTQISIQLITSPTVNETITIYKGEGVGGAVLWTSSVLGLVNGWNDITITTPFPIAIGQKYTVRVQAVSVLEDAVTFVGENPKAYAGGITNLVYIFPNFKAWTTALSANFVAKRSNGYFGFGGTSDPTEMVDVTGNLKVSGTAKTDLITEKTSANGIGFSVNSHTGKIKDNTNKWFYLTATGTNDDGMGIAIPYALADGWFFGKGMGASNTFSFGTAGTETTLTGDGQFKTNKLTLGATQQVDTVLTSTTLSGAADTNLATTLALKTYIDNKTWVNNHLFIAVKNANQNSVTGDGTFVVLTYGDEKKDVGNDFDGTYFVAPFACTMDFKVGCVFDIAAGTNTWAAINFIRLNSADVVQENVTVFDALVADNLNSTGNVAALGRSGDIVMASGDKVAVRVAVAGNATKNVSITSYNYQRFSGFLTYIG